MGIIFKKLNKTRIKGVILIFLAFIAVAVIIFIVGHFLEYHETNEFCGEFCHAMDTHYSSYIQPKNNTYMDTHFDNNVTCAQCHSGPGFMGQVKAYLGVPNEMWGEYIVGYDIEDMGGHVPSENCLKGCHEEAEVDWIFEAPKPKGEGYSEIDGELVWQRMEIYHPYTENGTSLKALEDLETCQDCHDPRDNSFGFAAEACHICHDVDEDELEHHGEYTCFMATCHRDESGEPVQPKLRGHGIVEDHCMVCHSRDHPEDAFVPYQITNSQGLTLSVNSSFCSACHEETYEMLSNISTKHFTETGCQECHLQHKTRPECLDCHEEGGAYEPIHQITTPFDECSNCHESAHEPLKISFNITNVSKDFCSDVSCHGGPDGEVYELESYGFKHNDSYDDCTTCHEIHAEEEIDCLSCHSQEGVAPLLSHSIENQYENCLECHESGHAPLNITFTLPNVQNDFCSDASCHGGTDGEYYQFENYGGRHKELYSNCTSCHTIHINYDDVLTVEKRCLDCHSSSPSDHTGPYTNEDCLACHNSPHDPKNIALRPGYNLSQRDYMINYLEWNNDRVTSFGWVKRGNHLEYGSCTLCHASAEEPIYPTSAQNLMNISGTDCSLGCHSWIDTTTTGRPNVLLTSTPNPFSGHLDEIFNNATGGGCAGTCHQLNPSIPDYSGSGHGTVANCLNSDCHGPGFDNRDWEHVEHEHNLDLLGIVCGEVCHKPLFPDEGEPIDGGCYDCHKSGHDPRIMNVSPCYTCHFDNLPP